MAAPLVVAVVHRIVRLEIPALQVKSGPPRDSRLWLRPAGRAMQREDEADHGNGPGTNSSESAVKHLSKSVVRDTEGAAKQKPHATFCGNRGWATAPGDPVRRTILG